MNHQTTSLPSVCCSVLQCIAVYCNVLQCIAVYCSVLKFLLCVAVCCSVLQCVAALCHGARPPRISRLIPHASSNSSLELRIAALTNYTETSRRANLVHSHQTTQRHVYNRQIRRYLYILTNYTGICKHSQRPVNTKQRHSDVYTHTNYTETCIHSPTTHRHV